LLAKATRPFHELGEDYCSVESRSVSELPFDAEDLIPFRQAFAAGEGTDFELPGVGRNSKVGNERVFGFARVGRYDG